MKKKRKDEELEWKTEIKVNARKETEKQLKKVRHMQFKFYSNSLIHSWESKKAKWSYQGDYFFGFCFVISI